MENKRSWRNAAKQVPEAGTCISARGRKNADQSTACERNAGGFIRRLRGCRFTSAGFGCVLGAVYITLDRMSAIRLRQLQQRDYRDPADFLRAVRAVELNVLSQIADPQIRRLRTRSLREWRETRLAALFCHGMSVRTGHKVYVSKGEFEDADSVAMWQVEDEIRFTPIQIKEVAPNDLNEHATLEQVIDSLGKYSDAEDLTVLIHLNRETRFTPSKVSLPSHANIAALWVLACVSPEQSRWALWGDYLHQPERSEFEYPV